MNTRSNADKAEVDKAYREALNPTTLRRPRQPQPQHTSTPFITREQQFIPSAPPETPTIPIPEVSDSIIRKILNEDPLTPIPSCSSAPPQKINIPPCSIEEEELVEQSPIPQESSACIEPTQYQSFDKSSAYSFRLVISDSVIQSSEKIIEKPEQSTAVINKINTVPINKRTMSTDEIPSNNSFATLKYAVDAVPFFDGENIPFERFEEGCELAKAMLPPESEPFLTKIIHTRLTGEARRSINDQDFTRINQLLKYLRNLFRPSKNLYELQAELGRIYQKAGEKVLYYANRVKSIGKNILEIHRSSCNGSVDRSFQVTLENEMRNSFIKGLTTEIEQRIARNLDVTETVDEALRIERELNSIKEIRGTSNLLPKINIESCQICKKLGHTADKCRLYQTPTTSSLGNEILICQICKKRGHSAEKCRFREPINNPVRIVQSNTVTCQICSKSGHSAQNCHSLNTAPKVICFACQKPGHISRECRSKNSNIIICQMCNKPGHNAKDCYSNPNRNNNNSNFNNETCQSCGRRGHQAAQCQQRLTRNNNSSANNIQMICQLCNKFGHRARDCRVNQTSNNFNQIIQNLENQCRYCKSPEHLIENCILRVENNRRRQGNFSGSLSTGVTQVTDGTGRPAMIIQAQ